MRNGRTRILHVIQNLNYGGMERLVADIVNHVDADRFESHVLVLQYLGRFAQDMHGAAAVHQAEPLSPYSMLWPRLLVRQIKRIAPDVVHSHSGVWYKAALAARLAGVSRIVHTEHGRQSPDPLQARLIDGIASRRTDVAVAVSDEVAGLLARSIVRGSCRIVTIVNGVDTELHRPLEDDGRLRADLEISPLVPIIGSIGRLEAIKGYDYMIRAFALLSQDWDGPEAPVLIIAGDGSERARLERDAAAAGIAARTHFLGWRDDVGSLLRAFNLFTMSSRSEGTSVSLLEAMSAGLCPVVTDVGGNAAVLGAPLRHRLTAPHDPIALAAAWRDALGDPVRLRIDARAARSRILDAYSLDTMVEGYQRLYGEA